MILLDSAYTRWQRADACWKPRTPDFSIACCTCRHHRYPDADSPHEPTWCSEHQFETERNAVCIDHEDKP